MEIADARRFQMQSFMTIKNWTTVAVFGFNGRAVFGFNGRDVFGFNGRAVSLDSQGCKPLVGVPNMTRESRSDGIGSPGPLLDKPLANTRKQRHPQCHGSAVPDSSGHNYQGFAPLAIKYHRSAIQLEIRVQRRSRVIG